jgi:oligopeptide/dipeptide ABC transporter ATP-binding protein
VQSQILALLRDIQAQRGISYLFISHDLAVIRQIAQRVIVMYLGRVVETGDVTTLFSSPAHPYSVALLDARPAPDPDEEQSREHIVLRGSVPSAYDPPTGCPFHTRCWKTQALGNPDICRTTPPALATVGANQMAACHFPEIGEGGERRELETTATEGEA